MSYEIGVLGSQRIETVFIMNNEQMRVTPSNDTPKRGEVLTSGFYPSNDVTKRAESSVLSYGYFITVVVYDHIHKKDQMWPNYWAISDRPPKRGEGISPFWAGEKPKRKEQRGIVTNDTYDTPKRSETPTFLNS